MLLFIPILPSIIEPSRLVKNLPPHKGALTKHLYHTQQIFPVKGGGGQGESANKGKFVTKIFLQARLNEVQNICKK